MKPTEQQFQLVRQARRLATERGPDSGNRLEEELRVHAIELELQNEELQDSRARLETSQDEFRRLFELAPVAYLTIDDRGEIMRANRAAHRLLASRQLMHERLSRFVRSYHFDECERLLATRGDEPASTELEFSRGGASDSWTALAQAVRLKLEADCVLVCLQDVTELRRAVQRSRDSEDGLRGLVEGRADLK